MTMFNTGEQDPNQSITNIASVPHRSPFRYPSGKTWLIPTVRKWLKQENKIAKELIEPFAGGAFCTILKNRIFHGGILAKGSGMIKNGENGKGIASR